ncbi:MAG: hypothetical protein EAX81_05880 [Candidatus Thorarchaeota archaeon]|nr:hypothetical protein [Candidatus Thorarchaeota archaeon]
MEKIRKFFGKEDEDKLDETEETEQEDVAEAESAPAVEEEDSSESAAESDVQEHAEEAVTVVKQASAARGSTIPYHAELTERLRFMFHDPTISGSIEGTDEFVLEFMAMGERFNVKKQALGDVVFGTGTAPNEDAFIRISNDVVSELLSASTFDEFANIYMKYHKNPDGGKFVKIELRKDIGGLNRRGYARVPLLKLLVGQIR